MEKPVNNWTCNICHQTIERELINLVKHLKECTMESPAYDAQTPNAEGFYRVKTKSDELRNYMDEIQRGDWRQVPDQSQSSSRTPLINP